MAAGLLRYTSKGIYCEQADVYIDPHKKVDRAFITHGHGDHARSGHGSYLCTKSALPVIRHRLGTIAINGIDYGETITVNGVKFSFHPAGHIIGSAQIRVEYQGEVWVASGDYRVQPDGFCESFEPVKCDHFITESTFAHPKYVWPKQTDVAKEINDWIKDNQAKGITSIFGAYALGKAQRLLHLIEPDIAPIFTHQNIFKINEVLDKQGIVLQETTKLRHQGNRPSIKNSIVLCTPSHLKSKWMKEVGPYKIAKTTGWAVKEKANNIDQYFTLSDHADWKGLNEAIQETGAENIYTLHGSTKSFANYLCKKGLNATAWE